MTNRTHFHPTPDSFGSRSRVITDRDENCRLQQMHQLGQKRLTNDPLSAIMRAVAKLIAGLMRVKRKHVPEKNTLSDFVKHIPNNRCRPFCDWHTYSCAL
jgi:hypothetical protein